MAPGQEAAPRNQHLPRLRTQRCLAHHPRPWSDQHPAPPIPEIEALYDTLLHPTQGHGLSPKTVYSIHLIIRGALADAIRRGLVTRNVALLARAPRQRHLQRIEGIALTEEELRQFLRTAAGHRFFPIYWLTAMTGMRRNEVLGLKWPDIDVTKKRVNLHRGLVAVGYEVH